LILVAEAVPVQSRLEAAAMEGIAGSCPGRKVAIDLPQLPASEFLTRLLSPYGMTFHIERNSVRVIPK